MTCPPRSFNETQARPSTPPILPAVKFYCPNPNHLTILPNIPTPSGPSVVSTSVPSTAAPDSTSATRSIPSSLAAACSTLASLTSTAFTFADLLPTSAAATLALADLLELSNPLARGEVTPAVASEDRPLLLPEFGATTDAGERVGVDSVLRFLLAGVVLAAEVFCREEGVVATASREGESTVDRLRDFGVLRVIVLPVVVEGVLGDAMLILEVEEAGDFEGLRTSTPLSRFLLAAERRATPQNSLTPALWVIDTVARAQR